MLDTRRRRKSGDEITMSRKGKIYEGRWKVVRCERNCYYLENIYNHEEMKIGYRPLQRVEKGETTISQIRCLRATRDKNNPTNSPYPYKNKAITKVARRITYEKQK